MRISIAQMLGKWLSWMFNLLPCEHEYELVEEVHFWEHECKRSHPKYPEVFNKWYLFSHEVKKCKHCGKINIRKFDNGILPLGGRDVCYRTLY